MPTPNMDRLATRGQRFTNAVGSFHQTTMSMGALFTGRTPSLESGDVARPFPLNGNTWCGLARLRGAADQAARRCVPADVATLAERMHDAGYRTLGVTSNQLLFRPGGYEQGFDEWIEVGEVPPEGGHGHGLGAPALRAARSRDASHVLDTVTRALDGVPAARRLFAYVHFMDVHDWYVPGDRTRPITAVANYRRAVADVDAAVGRLMAALEARGLLDRSVVLLTADHGEAHAERHAVAATPTHFGNPSFEPVVTVPLLTSVRTGVASDTLMRSEDVFRLLLDLAGLSSETPSDLERDELFFSELMYQTYRSGRWKSMHPRGGGRTLLFDLERDPAELHDVFAAEPEVAARHAERVATLATRVSAPRALPGGLSNDDRDRLKALGYLED